MQYNLQFICFCLFLRWRGEGEDEVGVEKETGIVRVKVNPRYYRPTEVEYLQGDCSKARKRLKWEPKYDFKVGYFSISSPIYSSEEFFYRLLLKI